MKLNSLTDPLIQSDWGLHSLPGLMAEMARGEVAGFPALRPYQRPAWHMFLVQLATLALDARERSDLPEAEVDWGDALRALTPAHPDDAPWHLVVEDRAKPAFLQPPDPGGLKWSAVPTPDALDMLITARNHDLKARIAQEAAPQDWIFALVSVQTMEGFGGAGNYGIARMNGGSSSRVMLSLAPVADASSAPNPSHWWALAVGTRGRHRQGADLARTMARGPVAAARRARSPVHRRLPPCAPRGARRCDRRAAQHVEGRAYRREGGEGAGLRRRRPMGPGASCRSEDTDPG